MNQSLPPSASTFHIKPFSLMPSSSLEVQYSSTTSSYPISLLTRTQCHTRRSDNILMEPPTASQVPDHHLAEFATFPAFFDKLIHAVRNSITYIKMVPHDSWFVGRINSTLRSYINRDDANTEKFVLHLLCIAFLSVSNSKVLPSTSPTRGPVGPRIQAKDHIVQI